jgi:hypothetical protein
MDSTTIDVVSSTESMMMMKDSVMVRRHLLNNNTAAIATINTTTSINPTNPCSFNDLDDLMLHSKLLLSATAPAGGSPNGDDDWKQESLSEILAHGEVQELRDWFHRTMIKMQSLERERDYYEGKCEALAQVLQVTQDADETTSLLQQSRLQVAELSLEVEQRKLELQQYTSKITLLEQEKEATRTMLVELSGIVQAFSDGGRGGWSGQECSNNMMDTSISSSHSNHKNNFLSTFKPSSSPIKQKDTLSSTTTTTSEITNNNNIITPAMACEMTIRGLKAQVEALEDERGEMVGDMVRLQTTCDEMRKENEARALKIAALEKQFHSINQARELVVAQLIKKGRIDANSSRNLMKGLPAEDDDDDDNCSMRSMASSRRSLRWPRVSKNNKPSNSATATTTTTTNSIINPRN